MPKTKTSARTIAGLRSPVSRPASPVPGLLVCLTALAVALGMPAHAAPAKSAPAPKQQTAIAGDPEAAAALMAKGDAAAQAGRVVDALDAWRKAYERLFPSFRGVCFKTSVKAEYLDRAALRSRLLEVLARDMPDDEILAEQRAMAAFGFIPPDFDLKEAILRLHTEQIAGFYDPAKKCLFLIRDGSGEPLDLDQQKMTLAHEMSHALMDQYHDLDAMERAVEDDDDASLGMSALVEGEATLAMLAAMDPERSAFFLRLPPALLDLAMTLLKPFLSFAGGPAFASAPVILKEPMLFPYLKGLPFCLGLTGKSGTWKLVDTAFAHPPISTEQVLHPSRYPGDVPIALSFPDVAPDLGEGWTLAHANVVGELATRVLLAESLPIFDAEKASEGWGGDLYRVYARPAAGDADAQPELALVWVSTWDTQGEAREFRDACARHLAARIGFDPQDVTELRALPNDHWGCGWIANECLTAVLGRGTDVWVLSRIPEKAFPAVLAKALQVARRPKEILKRKT